MEPIIQLPRYRRPLPLEPNTPTRKTMAPTPRDYSSAQHSRSTAPPTPRDSSGGASLLQERLRERKVESARQDRRRSVDMAGGHPQIQSSPVNGSRRREERRPSSSGVTTSKGMGVKQIEDQVSTLHKQNFDLKLQLYHRKQRQEALEARLEAAEKGMEEMRQVQEVNEQLVAELEKRDQAVEEAVGIIVSLEDQLDRWKQERGEAASRNTEYFGGEHDGPPSSPPQFEDAAPKPAKEQPRQSTIARMPSFLSEQSEGAEALRSLYLPINPRNSDMNLPRLSEETTDGMNSPRLSVLSESSFLSVYGDKSFKLDKTVDQEEEPPPGRHQKISSVEQWVESRPAAATPSPASRQGSGNKSQFMSLNDVLESPLQRLEKLKFTLEKHNSNHQRTLQRSASTKDDPRNHEPLRRVTDNPSFEKQHPLPATPDTISTSTLRHYQYSNDTLGQDADREAISSTAHNPVSQMRRNAFQTTLLSRPRSACETVTSRREGHGWDTETQNDDSSTASVYDPQPCRGPNRIPTPNLFMFGNFADDDRDWGRDIVFGNADFPQPPTRAVKAYNNNLRRSSWVEQSRSDETADISLAQYNPGPMNSSAMPNLPDRRSSLSATAKLRKTNFSASSGSTVDGNVASSATTPSQDGGKKARLLSRRLFGRSETTPVVSAVSSSQSPTFTANADHGQSQFLRREESSREYATATPPPIKRSRTVQGAIYRPSSADTDVAGGATEQSSFYRHDGAEVRRSAQVDTPDGNEPAKSSGRKWFGRGNLRRN